MRRQLTRCPSVNPDVTLLTPVEILRELPLVE